MTQTFTLTPGKPQSGGTSELGFESLTLEGGKSAAVQLVKLRCGDLTALVLPTRGMSILEVQHADGLGNYGWKSPVSDPVHPMWVPVSEPNGLGFLDGFNEMLVRCGLESNGAPQHDEQGQLQYPLHGRIANLPASCCEVELDAEAGTIELSGIVEETRFHIRRTRLVTKLKFSLSKPNEIQVVDEVHNFSDRPSDFQLLYHINIGTPVLEPGAKFVSPFSMVCPRNEHAASGIENWTTYLNADPTYEEQVYFAQMGADSEHRTKTLLQSAEGNLGFSVGYKTDQLPCFSLWKNTVGHLDGYVTGLEPATNYPNRRLFEETHNRVVPLASGEKKQFELTLGFQRTKEEVAAVANEIAGLVPESQAVHSEPQEKFCEP